MNHQQAKEAGLSIFGSPGRIRFIPQIAEPGPYLPVAEMARQVGVHRTTLMSGLPKKRLILQGRRWMVSTYTVAEYLAHKHRYTKAGPRLPRQGRRWNRWELLVVGLDAPVAKITRRLGRTLAAVRVMRCRLRKGTR